LKLIFIYDFFYLKSYIKYIFYNKIIIFYAGGLSQIISRVSVGSLCNHRVKDKGKFVHILNVAMDFTHFNAPNLPKILFSLMVYL